jgi:Raf kinase inhibitor-like YbhB/YbcL family protein
MQRRLALLTTVTFLVAIGVAAAPLPQGGGAPPAGQGGRGGAPPAPLKLMSPDLSDGSKLADKFGCAAGNDAVSPAVQWSQPTRDSVTLVLMVHDMEGHPRKGVDDILHWMVWNIPSSATGLPQGISTANYELPDGSYQTNGFVAQAPAAGGGRGGAGGQGAQGGQAAQAQPPNFGYRAPCPPQNVPVAHHYAFELFAVDTKLDLPPSATRADVMKAMDGHVTGHASIVVPYNR